MKLWIRILQFLKLRSRCCGGRIIRWSADLTSMQEESFCERCGNKCVNYNEKTN